MSTPADTPAINICSINLLPRRKTRRQQHRQRFMLLAVLALLGALLTAFGLQYLLKTGLAQQQQQRRQQEQQILRLQQASPLPLDSPLAANDIHWLKQWLQQRDISAQLMRQLSTLTPDSVSLTHFRREGNRMTLTGMARTSKDLTQFEQSLASARHWQQVKRLNASAAYHKQFPVLRFSLTGTLASTPRP